MNLHEALNGLCAAIIAYSCIQVYGIRQRCDMGKLLSPTEAEKLAIGLASEMFSNAAFAGAAIAWLIFS
jgi:hypothetical protein